MAACVSQLVACVEDSMSAGVLLWLSDFQRPLQDAIVQLRASLPALVEETREMLGSGADDGEAATDGDGAKSPAHAGLLEAVATAVASAMLLMNLLVEELPEEVPAVTEALLEKARADIATMVPPPPMRAPADEGGGVTRPDGTVGLEELLARQPSVWDFVGDSAEDITYADDSRIKAVSLPKLIERLTAASGVPDQVKVLKTFVTTYSSMGSPLEILRYLFQRWHVPAEFEAESKPIRARVTNLLRQFVEANFRDLTPTAVEVLREFIVTRLLESAQHRKWGETLKDFVDRQLRTDVETAKRSLVELKLEPKIPLSPGKFLTVFNEREIANQLTLVESQIYRRIMPREFLSQAWAKEKLKYRAPNVRALIARSTALSWWVASSILWQPSLKERSRVLTKLINVGEHLLQLNNFNSLMALISGINLSPIYRLKHTWSEVAPAAVSTFRKLEAVMSSESSFASYRKHLHMANPPCVPFLGVYLTDLTFSDDGNPDNIGSLINFSKREQMFSVMQEILQYQSLPYRVEYVAHIAAFLNELPSNDENNLYSISQKVEPKNSDKDTIL